MSFIKIPRGWEIPESLATPERVFLDRRKFLQAAGVVGLGAIAATGLPACAGGAQGQAGAAPPPAAALPDAWKGLYPAKRNEKYLLDRALTDEKAAATYNNFYEFTTDKPMVAALAKNFPSYPWQIEIAGMVKQPKVYDIDDLLKKLPLEERLYRHRCVEAWAMAVPWTGFTLKSLLDLVEPLGSAKYVRMTSFLKPELALGQAKQHWYRWPYYEGLSMAEAANELTLLATGIYGHPMPMQHGAPIRLVTPWKYGFKSIKSIVKIEFVEKQPATFWNDAAPDEYGFLANVDPSVPHPRWSQASERLIDTGERVPTQPFNGYGAYVAGLYA